MAKTVQPEAHNEEEGLKIAHEKIKIWKENPPQTNLSLKGLKLTHIPSEVFKLMWFAYKIHSSTQLFHSATLECSQPKYKLNWNKLCHF